MQADDDVGRVAAGATFSVACAVDAFLNTLLGGAIEVATSRNARTLTSAHLKASVVADPLLDFCKEAVASAPDLPPLGADNDPAPPGKRSRSNKEGVDVAGSPQKQSRSRGGGRGRGRGKAAGVPTNEIEVGVDDTTAAIFTAGGLADASFLEAAPGKEAEEEDYDA